ncbi:hypothetical protein Droror1_Dr00027447, partial [Drosera rotundifolia]
MYFACTGQRQAMTISAAPRSSNPNRPRNQESGSTPLNNNHNSSDTPQRFYKLGSRIDNAKTPHFTSSNTSMTPTTQNSIPLRDKPSTTPLALHEPHLLQYRVKLDTQAVGHRKKAINRATTMNQQPRIPNTSISLEEYVGFLSCFRSILSTRSRRSEASVLTGGVIELSVGRNRAEKGLSQLK